MSEAKPGEPSSGKHSHCGRRHHLFKKSRRTAVRLPKRAQRDEGEPAGHRGTESQTFPVWSACSTLCPFIHLFLQHTFMLNITRYKYTRPRTEETKPNLQFLSSSTYSTVENWSSNSQLKSSVMRAALTPGRP